MKEGRKERRNEEKGTDGRKVRRKAIKSAERKESKKGR